MTKLQALAKHLECEIDELSETKHDENTFEHGSREYMVLTDSEADAYAKEQILQSLWAFNASFISGHTVNGLSNAAEKALTKAQGELCEDANDLVLAMIEDVDHFVNDAICSDGRGHFMSSYDGQENECGEFYVYRVN